MASALQGIYVKFGKTLPQDPWEQLVQSISAVFLSYNTPRAIKYRGKAAGAALEGVESHSPVQQHASTIKDPLHIECLWACPLVLSSPILPIAMHTEINKITELKGTACNVQSMGAFQHRQAAFGIISNWSAFSRQRDEYVCTAQHEKPRCYY